MYFLTIFILWKNYNTQLSNIPVLSSLDELLFDLHLIPLIRYNVKLKGQRGAMNIYLSHLHITAHKYQMLHICPNQNIDNQMKFLRYSVYRAIMKKCCHSSIRKRQTIILKIYVLQVILYFLKELEFICTVRARSIHEEYDP